jgi:RNA polymerase sigma factor (TIGR02999 family)
VARDPTQNLSTLIDAARSGDDDAIAALFSLSYAEVHRLAHALRRGEARHTLNTTALVHEAYFKLLPSSGLSIESLAHFKHIVGRAMRQVLVDHARASSAGKRGGPDAVAVTLSDEAQARQVDHLQMIQLHTALVELERVDPRSARVVECRFFSGLDVEETAAALGISTATVKRDWRVARAWLNDVLLNGGP